jgi:hypothetical protein
MEEREMTEAETRLCDWQYDRSGSFFTALYELMGMADGDNLARLARGFPDDVAAFLRFRNENEYWQTLEKEYNA